jgi:hypothetical protein
VINHATLGGGNGERPRFSPLGLALDATDPACAPQLLITESESARVLSMDLHTRRVMVIAGALRANGSSSALRRPCTVARSIPVIARHRCRSQRRSVCGGPARQQRPSHQRCKAADGAGSRHANRCKSRGGGGAYRDDADRRGGAHRAVCTLLSAGFRESVRIPRCLALHVPAPSVAVDRERDVGRLYVSSKSAVHAFDLTSGECTVTALAVTDDGARLFVVGCESLSVVNTRTGAFTVLTRFEADVRDCVIDKATRSLVMTDYDGRKIVRFCGVDV